MRDRQAVQEERVRHTFEGCKQALINYQADQVMLYIPQNVDDYLSRLNSASKGKPAASSGPAGSEKASPGVDLLLRTALAKKVPDDLRPRLTLELLLQRIAEKRLLNTHDVEQIDLGRVSISGDRASAELYYEGTLTALRLPFVKEGDEWKIDVLAVLPYAEILMRLDRALKDETQDQQVDFLVSKLPSL